jgi:hypothetical protein
MSNPHSTPTRADWWARIPAHIALVVSGLSFLLTYETVLPSLAAKVEFVNPIVTGENFTFQIDLDNNGNSTAIHMEPDLRFGWAPASVDFKPYGPGLNINVTSPDWKPTVSDLGPRGHTRIISETPMNFANDATVQDVNAGTTRFYVFGKIPYRDVLHLSHEFHLCFFYIRTPGSEPLRFVKCSSYNETE